MSECRIRNLAVIIAAILWGEVSGFAEAPLKRHRFSERHMGVEVEISVYAADAALAKNAAAAAYARMAEIDRALSDYREDSELNALNRTAGQSNAVRVSDDLWVVLSSALHHAQRTDGAFDPTVGPVVKLWRRARRKQRLPDAEDLRQALDRVGWHHVRVDRENRTVELTRPGMRLDFGGIAKGYAVDQAGAILRNRRMPRFLIDAGGDLLAGGPPLGESAWSVAVETTGSTDAAPVLRLTNQAVATSGDAHQFLEFDGVRYSHIVDPHTGLGLTTPMSVTVVAGTGMQADALASAVSILGPNRGIELVEKLEQADVRIETGQPMLRRQQSDGWREFEIRPPKDHSPCPAGPGATER